MSPYIVDRTHSLGFLAACFFKASKGGRAAWTRLARYSIIYMSEIITISYWFEASPFKETDFSRTIFGWRLSKGRAGGRSEGSENDLDFCLFLDTFFTTLSQGYYSAPNRNFHWRSEAPSLWEVSVCFDVAAGRHYWLHPPEYSLQSVIPVV